MNHSYNYRSDLSFHRDKDGAVSCTWPTFDKLYEWFVDMFVYGSPINHNFSGAEIKNTAATNN